MKTATRLLALSVLASGAFFTTSTFACSTDAWESASTGATPGDPTADIARVAGKCGLEVTSTGLVIDNNPDAETTFIARFYFFGKNLTTGTHTIFRATSGDGGAGTEQFKITYNGSTGAIAIQTKAASGGSTSAAALKNRWNLVEVSWKSGATGSLWVNADATKAGTASGTFASGTGSVGSVQLGAVSNVAGKTAFFDDYVSHRTTPVGPVLLGDSNNDGQVNVVDATATLREAARYGAKIQVGTPDCNLDGQVNIVDATSILRAAARYGAVRCTNGAL